MLIILCHITLYSDVRLPKNKSYNIIMKPNDNKKLQLIKIAEDKVEKIIRKLLYWENDDKQIGKIIRRIHHFMIYSGITCYFMIHTVMPSYFIFLVLYLFWALVWLQHFILGGCVIGNIENNLIGDTTGFMTPIFDMLKIDVSVKFMDNLIFLTSTLILSVLTYELVIRTSRYMKLKSSI